MKEQLSDKLKRRYNFLRKTQNIRKLEIYLKIFKVGTINKYWVAYGSKKCPHQNSFIAICKLNELKELLSDKKYKQLKEEGITCIKLNKKQIENYINN